LIEIANGSKKRLSSPSRSVRSLIRYHEEEAGNGKVKKDVEQRNLSEDKENLAGECEQVRRRKNEKKE
jgi:hypothetical protein